MLVRVELTATLVRVADALGCVCILPIAASEGGVAAFIKKARQSDAVATVARWLESDWVRGLGGLLLPELLVVFVALSCLNQCSRKAGLVEGQWDTKPWLTDWTRDQLESIARWDRTSVLVKAVWLSLLYWVFAVVFGRLTTLFLIWLRTELLSVRCPSLLCSLDCSAGHSAFPMALHHRNVLTCIVYRSLFTTSAVYIASGLTSESPTTLLRAIRSETLSHCARLYANAVFLLPPVPGMPVYLTGGLVRRTHCDSCTAANCQNCRKPAMLTPLCPPPCARHLQLCCHRRICACAAQVICPRAEAEFDNFFLGAIYSSVISFAVKLLAISMQQKIIGEQLGHNVAVRRAIQVNSPTMKAIKLILAEPGLSFGKVMILIGGPGPSRHLPELFLPEMLFHRAIDLTLRDRAISVQTGRHRSQPA